MHITYDQNGFPIDNEQIRLSSIEAMLEQLTLSTLDQEEEYPNGR